MSYSSRSSSPSSCTSPFQSMDLDTDTPSRGSKRGRDVPSGEPRDKKRARRREQNRCAAAKSRVKKKHFVETLIEEMEQLKKQNAEMKSNLEQLAAENQRLKRSFDTLEARNQSIVQSAMPAESIAQVDVRCASTVSRVSNLRDSAAEVAPPTDGRFSSDIDASVDFVWDLELPQVAQADPLAFGTCELTGGHHSYLLGNECDGVDGFDNAWGSQPQLSSPLSADFATACFQPVLQQFGTAVAPSQALLSRDAFAASNWDLLEANIFE